MFVHTYGIILTIRVVLPFVNVLTSLVPCKQFNTNPIAFMITINAQIDWTPTNISQNANVYNCGLLCI
jgi:hypothetical protein